MPAEKGGELTERTSFNDNWLYKPSFDAEDPFGTAETEGYVQAVSYTHLLVEAGDNIPADARLIESASLKSEESALTGESVPSEKDASLQIKENACLLYTSFITFTHDVLLSFLKYSRKGVPG